MRVNVVKVLLVLTRSVPVVNGTRYRLSTVASSVSRGSMSLQQPPCVFGFASKQQSQQPQYLKRLEILFSSQSSKSLPAMAFKQQIDSLLSSSGITTFQEQIAFHRRVLAHFLQQDASPIINSIALCEQLTIFLLYRHQEESGLEVEGKALEKLYFSIGKNLQFESEKTQFEVLCTLQQTFKELKSESAQLQIIEEVKKCSDDIKKLYLEDYIVCLRERVTLSQLARNHEDTIAQLDNLFEEIDRLPLSGENSATFLNECYAFYLRGTLLAKQFNKPDNEKRYEQLQAAFILKTNYNPRGVEKLITEVKKLQDAQPHYFVQNGEKVNGFVEEYENSFKGQVRDTLLSQIYNQVVPLNVHEYVYMLVKFEDDYKQEVESIADHLSEPDDLVEGFEQMIVDNVETLLHIRRLVRLFTKEVLEINMANQDIFETIQISSWITLVDESTAEKVNKLFEEHNEKTN